MFAYSPLCPICPSCSVTMRLGRRVPAFNNQPELQNFECRPCGIIFTEAAAQPIRLKFTLPVSVSA